MIVRLVLLSCVLFWSGVVLSSNSSDTSSYKLFIGNEGKFPRNITHIFKGSWKFINESKPESVRFVKQEGAIWFSLRNIAFSDEVDIVDGEAVVRDGIYSTDENMRFALQGAYFFQQGTLLLLANPLLPFIETVPANFSVLGNMSVSEAFETAEKIIIKEVNSFNITDEARLCPFKFTLQMQHSEPENVAKPKPEELLNADSKLHPQTKNSNFSTAGLLVSSFCDVFMSVSAESIHLSVYMTKWINYVVMVSLSSFVQIVVLIRQMEYTGSQAFASKMSLLTVGAQAVQDVYLCLIHLVAGILIEQMFSAFVTAAFFQFVTFLIFEMRYLMVILKARRPQAFAEGWVALRREFSLFYVRFYTIVISGFLLFFYLSHLFYLFIFLLYSFWVPQIIANAQQCSRRPVLWQYVIGMTITRLAIPLYFYGCPQNFLSVEPSSKFCFFLVAYMALQVFVLYLQDKKGPQFFVPKQFLPIKYNYGRPLTHNMSEDQRNCVICMREVEVNETEHMITPCDHVFHSECLMQWLDVKLECPTCRRTLPTP